MQKTCKNHGELKPEDIQIEKIRWTTKDGESKIGEQYRCRICRREKDMKYKHAHKDKRLAYNKKWREENREHVNEREREHRKKHPEKFKLWAKNNREKQGKMRSLGESLRLRNIDIVSYNEMFKYQNGACAICKKPETKKSRKDGDICRLAIDHCHDTNIVRGLLCHHCNAAIGHFEDDISLLEAAINYLKQHEH